MISRIIYPRIWNKFKIAIGGYDSIRLIEKRLPLAKNTPIILFSGMAADERLFESQLAAFSNLRVQPWIKPFPDESLRAYAARIAQCCDPGRRCIVGGASFGGIVALEMAQHLPALACILIGSIRSPASLPQRLRLLRPFARLGPDNLQVLAAVCAKVGRRFLARKLVRRFQQLSLPDSTFVRW
ncbi:MAG TPA: alpha/beta fold hydrolase, partial [Gemmata sp.]|nr:alpha/beta fold hydrolase [Gemmata sp.]